MAKKKGNKTNNNQPDMNETAAQRPPDLISRRSTRGAPGAFSEILADAEIQSLKAFPEVQRDVYGIIKSMYGEDVATLERKSAWGKPLLTFTTSLKAFEDDEVHVKLEACCPSEYPKLPPAMKIENITPDTDAVRKSIMDICESVPKQQPNDDYMIITILQDVEQFLSDFSDRLRRNEQGESLETERAVKESTEQAEAADKQQKMAQQKLDEETRRAAELAKDIEDHRRRRQNQSLVPNLNNHHVSAMDLPEDAVSFEHEMQFTDPKSQQKFYFQTVRPITLLSTVQHLKVSIVCPLYGGALRPVTMILKQISILESLLGNGFDLGEIESGLQEALQLQHQSVVQIVGYKLEQSVNDKDTGDWQLSILTEMADGGSLTRMLDVVGELSALKLRPYVRSALDALEYFDKRGYVHPAIHATNVLFFSAAHGAVLVKLSDGYGSTLRELLDRMQPNKQSKELASSGWAAPELAGGSTARTNKTCIWELGVIVLQMVLGNKMTEIYTSPEDALSRAGFAMDFDDLVSKMCSPNPRKRPNAFNLHSHQFFKSNERTVFKAEGMKINMIPTLQRSRSTFDSRWLTEWEDPQKLGKGGFGTVYKTRNRLDGHFYAVKQMKCQTTTDLEEIWSEVRMLAQLNHPSIVRYFGAWNEDDMPDMTETSGPTPDTDPRSFAIRQTDSGMPDSNIFALPSTGHDFMDAHNIDFADVDESSDEDENPFAYQSAPSESDEEDVGEANEDEQAIQDDFSFGQKQPFDIDEEDNPFGSEEPSKEAETNSVPSRPRKFEPVRADPSWIRRPKEFYAKKSTLYIQMELCDTGTLVDLINAGLPNNIDESWRLFRLILDGLQHIHAKGIVHRDLKPANIFIDSYQIPKIGDFGLASPGQALGEVGKAATHIAGPQSRLAGTENYIAPELVNRKSTGKYSSKADMFALGVIFFEMCFTFSTHFERSKWLKRLNESSVELPERFSDDSYRVQGRIIQSLLVHDPELRPAAKTLLLDPQIPEPVEDEKQQRLVERLIHGDADMFRKIADNFLNRPPTKSQVLAYAYTGKDITLPDSLLLETVKDKLQEVFRRHWAIESARQSIFPAEDFYSNAVKLLDPEGFAVQLPYDLTLPFARSLATGDPKYTKSYCFGSVFRKRPDRGVEPRRVPEADFDIVSNSAKDISLVDAQVMSVLDDVLALIDDHRSRPFTIIVSHGDLLELVLRFSRVPESQMPAVKRILSALHVGRITWRQVQQQLNETSLTLGATCISSLAQFNFACSVDELRQRILNILGKSKQDYAIKATKTLNRLQEVDKYLKLFRVRTPILFSPLSNNSEQLYKGSLMFQCIDNKSAKVIAVGGRYDALIRYYQTPQTTCSTRACGFRLSIAEFGNYFLKENNQVSYKPTKHREMSAAIEVSRGDVVVTSFDESTLQDSCIDISRTLLDAGISADLSDYYSNIDELDQAYAAGGPLNYWLVIVRPIASNQKAIKVRSPTRDENDVQISDLVDFLRSEIGDRHQTGNPAQEPTLRRTRSSHGAAERENVTVLTPQHKSKKVNRAIVVDSARQAAQEAIESISHNSKILAIDTDDSTLQQMRSTRLADSDSWRALKHSVALNEREYVVEIQEQLMEWANSGVECAFVCNYKTKTCVFYDLKL